ncbi:hypothetical protein [Flammeovirga sp. EKP202]|uniref:hypothetical protein n=1 Tax=Flammeovirga sp. EKP202 TaxID=2770592 RepID=UPI00165F56A0|nr:hypothetical protein [Flammeovirga sp. EKP202]MBD0405160.1 hypothetical protein [Flammeovirga sp. EKP202]
MSHLRDNNAIYRDGSSGGYGGEVNAGLRINNGYNQGKLDAAQIIASISDINGNIIETIKVITHSMGGLLQKGI